MKLGESLGYKSIAWDCFVSLDRRGHTTDRCIQSLNLDSHEMMVARALPRSESGSDNIATFLRSEEIAERVKVAPLFLISAYGEKDQKAVSACVDYFSNEVHPRLPQAGMVLFSSLPGRSHRNFFHQHVPSKDFREFERKVARHIEMLMENQAEGSPLVPSKGRFSSLLIESDGDVPAELPIDIPFTLCINRDGVPFEMYCRLRKGANRLLVLGQDAITRSRVKLPHFFRWSWIDEIDASCIVLNDPTLYLGSDLNGGWFVGSVERDYAKECAELVKRIGVIAGVAAPPVYFGVSAGGFSSLAMAACTPGARAIVDIPQVDLTTYHVRHEVEKLVLAAFGADSIASVPDHLRYRLRIVDRFRHEGRVPDVMYLQNIRDTAHREQFDGFIRDWSTLAHALRDEHVGGLRLETYDRWSLSKGGHFPMSKDRTLQRVAAFLAS